MRRASKGDGPGRVGRSSFEARFRSHLSMTENEHGLSFPRRVPRPSVAELPKLPFAPAHQPREAERRKTHRPLHFVTVDSDIAVSARTVGELRKVTAWPENLVITTPQERDPKGAVRVSTVSVATRTTPKP